jgi:hypothetical protein
MERRVMSPCPVCGRDAPIVYRGVVPYCTACGALRAPLSTASVNLAGKPATVGGLVASVAGGLVLLVGGSIALGVALVFAAFHLLGLGLALASPIALVSIVVGVVLVWRGGLLRRAGARTEQTTHEQALLELVAHRGWITATDAAVALGLGIAEADERITALAKRHPERIAVDVDDEGLVRYRIARLGADMGPSAGAADAFSTPGGDDTESAPRAAHEKRVNR